MNPQEAPAPTPVQGAAITPTSMPPVNTSDTNVVIKKRKFPKTIIALVLLVVVGATARFILLNKPSIPTPQPSPIKKELVFEEYPEFPGIPINENTVSFLKLDGKFCLRYKGKIYIPQDTGSLVPRFKTENAEMANYPWIGLVDAPADLLVNGGPGDTVLSFEESPSNKSFVFIMSWKTEEGEKYRMFRFNNNSFSELRVFTQKDGLYYVPRINMFSLGGNFLNLSLFRCSDCITEQPETLLYYIPTGEDRNIGKVSYFKWGEDDNVYEYKEYEEGVDPADQLLRTNEFFERSIDLLSP